MKKTHHYIHHYWGYWYEGDKCRIRIHCEDGCTPVVICSQPPDDPNTSVTNMAEYQAAEVIVEHGLLMWSCCRPTARSTATTGSWTRAGTCAS